MKIIQRLLKVLTLSLVNITFFFPFYLFLLKQYEYPSNDSKIFIYSAAQGLAITILLLIFDLWHLKGKIQKVMVIVTSLLLSLLFAWIALAGWNHITFLVFILLLANSMYIVREYYQDNGIFSDSRRIIKKRLIIAIIALIYFWLLNLNGTIYFSLIIKYFSLYFIASLVILSQSKIVNVYDDNDEEDENALAMEYGTKKNIIVDGDKSIRINFILMFIVLVSIYIVAIQGSNIVHSPLGLLVGGILLKVREIINFILMLALQGIFFVFFPLFKWLFGRRNSELIENDGGDMGDLNLEKYMASTRQIKFIANLTTVFEVVVYAIIILFILLLIYRSVKKLNTNNKDYIEEKEFVYSIKDGINDIKRLISKLLPNKKNQEEPSDLHPLRVLYKNLLIAIRTKGVELKDHDTPNRIVSKVETSLPVIKPEFEVLTGMYNELRYGEQDNINQDTIDGLYKEIKDNL